MTLTEFLLARIAEDVEGATPDEGWNVSGWDHDVPVQFWDYGEVHVGHKRFLAECEAKRRIVEEAWADHLQIEGEWGMGRGQDRMEAANDQPEVVRLLASIYADHPGYREEWRVS